MRIKQRKIAFLVGSVILLAICASFFVKFLDHHQAYIDAGFGWEFNDPILNWLPAIDLSIPIFSITYGSLLLYLFLNLSNWMEKVGVMALSYALIVLIRTIALILIPLEEPKELITMNDPFLDGLIYPGETTADLFFSGHMSTLVLLAYHSERKKVLITLSILLGIMLMIQHIHYSIDVFAAVPISIIVGILARLLYSAIVKPERSK